MKQALFLLGS